MIYLKPDLFRQAFPSCCSSSSNFRIRRALVREQRRFSKLVFHFYSKHLTAKLWSPRSCDLILALPLPERTLALRMERSAFGGCLHRLFVGRLLCRSLFCASCDSDYEDQEDIINCELGFCDSVFQRSPKSRAQVCMTRISRVLALFGNLSLKICARSHLLRGLSL